MVKKFSQLSCILLLAFSFMLPLGSIQEAGAEVQDVFDTYQTQDVFLYRGDLVSLKVYSLTRIAISTPGIVEIASADVDELLLVGQNVGETQLFVWDEYGKRQIIVKVLERDLDLVKARIEKLFEATQITTIHLEKNIQEGRLVATGRVLNNQKKVLADILAEFKAYILDLTVEDGDLIQIDVQVSELSTTLQKALGIDWNTGASGMILTYEEIHPGFDGSIGDLFKIGDFQRTSQILATVNALIAEGEARVLSKPSIVVTNNEEATFLVGGEIPVRTTTTSTGGTSVQENVTYTAYGIDVTMKPEIKGDKIDITMKVQIRDIDASNAVGENVAFTTRTANTKLLLNNGQTVVLAGLIKQNKSETVTGVPFLRRIPIVGILFTNKNWPTDSEQEVVISLTPRIVTPTPIGLRSGKPLVSKDEVLDQQTTEDKDTSEGDAEAEPLAEDKATDTKDQSATDTDVSTEQTPEVAPEVTPSEAISEKAIEKEEPSSPVAETGSVDKVSEPTSETVGDVSLEVPAKPATDKASQAITLYVQDVQKKISRAITFPYEAKEKGQKGTVTLSMVILSDGSLNEVKVKESSGYVPFDEDAVNTASILAPFSPFPPELDLEELVITVPITYSEDTLTEQPSK